MTQHRVLAQPGVVRADMHGVVGPVGDPDHREPGRVVDDEFDVVGVGSAAAMVDDDDRFGELLHPDLQMPVGHRALTGAGDRDLYRLGDLRVARDGDQRRGVERRKCLRGNTVGGHAALRRAARRRDARSRPAHRAARRRVIFAVPVACAEPSCRPRSRRSGVNRQISSRPPGTSNALTSNEENSSPLLAAARAEPSTASVNPATSRPRLPSAARSAG